MKLTDASKIAINFEMDKILEIEQFLIGRGIYVKNVRYYAIAIYNKRQDIDVVIDDDFDF